MNTRFKDLKIFAVPESKAAASLGKGSNQKEILICWESEDVSEELEGFLSKILSALQFNLNQDTFLIKLKPSEKINVNTLSKEIPVRYLISFGLAPGRLGLHFQQRLYQPFKHQKTQYLFADSLIDLFEERQRGEKQRSGALWKALKHIFSEQ